MSIGSATAGTPKSGATAIDKPEGLSPQGELPPSEASVTGNPKGLPPQDPSEHDGCCEAPTPKPTRTYLRGITTAVAGVLVVAGCVFDLLAIRPAWAAPVFVAAALVGGLFPARRALASLRRGTLDINALMVIAVVGALLIDHVEEAAMVVVLFSLAQWLEAQTLDRARRAIARLLDLAPSMVLVRHGDRDVWLAIDEVRPGAVMIVRPGDKFALDGVVQTGSSDVNQAPITGESVPVEKSPGDPVYAGTLNGHGALTVEVTKRRQDTTLARIIQRVESAQAARAPRQQFIDRFAAWYTPAVMAIAALVAAVPLVFAGQTADVWIYRALVLLVVSCPCALVISTPVSIVSALAGAARHGVLIKGGAHLERLASVRVVAFDKTGTLTTGALSVGRIVPLSGFTESEVLSSAAAVESHAEHPVAVAIAREATQRQLPIAVARNVRAWPGLGVSGAVSTDEVLCGTPRLFAERDRLTPDLSRVSAELVAAGFSPVLVARGSRAVGAIGLADRPRPDARRAVAELRHKARVAMLTGDHETTARAIGALVGVDEVRAGLLPQDKVKAVEQLRRAHGPVAMIGDGINDAPALAAADVGLVMGAIGSDVAIETADMALMTDDLRKVDYTIRLSHATLENIRNNVILAVGLKAAFVALTVAGVATLWMAVLADSGASVLVVANALRLRKFGL
ncbi:MAG: heavy metal translocating P-type ATPase [Vicinamibacterales bacterium]